MEILEFLPGPAKLSGYVACPLEIREARVGESIISFGMRRICEKTSKRLIPVKTFFLSKETNFLCLCLMFRCSPLKKVFSLVHLFFFFQLVVEFSDVWCVEGILVAC